MIYDLLLISSLCLSFSFSLQTKPKPDEDVLFMAIINVKHSPVKVQNKPLFCIWSNGACEHDTTALCLVCIFSRVHSPVFLRELRSIHSHTMLPCSVDRRGLFLLSAFPSLTPLPLPHPPSFTLISVRTSLTRGCSLRYISPPICIFLHSLPL